MIRNSIIGAMIVIAIVAIAAAFYNPKQNSQTAVNLQDRLSACGSLPNGATENATETSRMFINIPKDIYPDINLDITSHGAIANYISNGGQYGYALGAQGKSDCWSYYFEFDLATSSHGSPGSVDIGSKSGVEGIPDYLIHITVGSPASATSTLKLEGRIHGQLFLGPTCPVERIPPDPACAPRPYATSIGISKNIQTPETFLTIRTDASGTFMVSLPVGEYIFHPQGGSPFPRCDEKLVEVGSGSISNIIINCDTGIR